MKNLLITAALLVASLFATGQKTQYPPTGSANGVNRYLGQLQVDSGVLFNGNRPITAVITGLTGVNPGANTLSDWIEKTFYPSQVPTAGLTVTYSGTTSSSIVLEKMGSGADLTVTLNWTAGRQASTSAISTISVDAVNQTFSQPGAPGTVSGTKSSTVLRNTNKTFTNTVTTADGKTASANASVSFQTKWYYGFVSPATTSPSDADVIGLTGALTTSRTQPVTNVGNSTDRRLVIAVDASLDPSNLDQIWVGGFNSTGAFIRTVRSFTNASGFASSYAIYVQTTTTSGPISFEVR